MAGLSEIIAIKRLSEKVDCVDLKMQSKHHNFVCESLVTSNSHSTSYALLAYITAYLKVYYPVEYMASLLTSSTEDDKKLAVNIKEAKRMKLKLVQPKINESHYKFTVNKNNIVYPFTAVKQCGFKAVDAIIDERKKNGEYDSFEDFFERVNKRVVNVGVMINLTLANCFRKFGKVHEIFDELVSLRGSDNVYRAIYCGDCSYRYPVSIKKSDYEDNGAVCPNCGDTEVEVEDIGGKRFDAGYARLQVFGFNIDDNPLKPFLAKILEYECSQMSRVEEIDDGDVLFFPTKVINIKKHIDKGGNEMAFLDLTDGKYESSMTIFSKDWVKLKGKFIKNKCYMLKGEKNRGTQFLYARGTKVVYLG